MREPREWRPFVTAGGRDIKGADALLAPDAAQRSGPPPLLAGLREDDIAVILDHTARTVLDRGASVFRQGAPHDGIYLVESGRIRVFYTAPSGRELTLAYWRPGSFVGGPDVFDTGTHVWSGVAAQNSTVLHLPGAALKHLIAKVPALGISVIEGLAFKGRCYSGMAQILGTRSATERLVHVLLHLAELYGVPEERGIVIAAAFTHADIANMIGATRQWVTINLARFANLGIVGTHQTNLVIVQQEALATLKSDVSAKNQR